jgi:hypothetical protein
VTDARQDTVPALREPERLLGRLREIQEAIRDAVLAACETTPGDQLATAVGDEGGDTIFAVDRVSEAVLLEHFERLAREWPCLLVAEGLGHDGRQVLPRGARLEDTEMVVLVDPIDGTRGLMYQKRPAWVLTGVAPALGGHATLRDIQLAVQTEIPLLKQHLSDAVWAQAGRGARGERWNRLTGQRTPFPLVPSRASTLLQGFGGLARFFPGVRAELSAVDDEVVRRLLGPPQKGRALAFEDQYISTGGQLYELMIGHDRWIGDLRPLAEAVARRRGEALGLSCHPYDLSTELIAREAGVIVTDADGGRLSAPLDVFSEVSWIGYANARIHEQVQPALRAALKMHGLGGGVEAPSPVAAPASADSGRDR